MMVQRFLPWQCSQYPSDKLSCVSHEEPDMIDMANFSQWPVMRTAMRKWEVDDYHQMTPQPQHIAHDLKIGKRVSMSLGGLLTRIQ
jgi:hypothetical protein